LKTFRVIRATDKATLELKARLQAEAWDERWRKILAAQAKRKKWDDAARQSFQKKELALQRTREVEQQQSDLSKILAEGIETDHVLDWETLSVLSLLRNLWHSRILHRRPVRTNYGFLPRSTLLTGSSHHGGDASWTKPRLDIWPQSENGNRSIKSSSDRTAKSEQPTTRIRTNGNKEGQSIAKQLTRCVSHMSQRHRKV
jgi:hypothetical protein